MLVTYIVSTCRIYIYIFVTFCGCDKVKKRNLLKTYTTFIITLCDQRVSERERHRPINYDDFTIVVRNNINNINYKPILMD
jgi:hypothetical protein